MMTSANWMSVLKDANWLRSWGGYAVAVIAKLKVLAPYAAIELILPGGSVMALLLWLYRRRKNGVPISLESQAINLGRSGNRYQSL